MSAEDIRKYINLLTETQSSGNNHMLDAALAPQVSIEEEDDFSSGTPTTKCCKYCNQPVICLDPETQWYAHAIRDEDGHGPNCNMPRHGPNSWVMAPSQVVECGSSESEDSDCSGGVCELEEDDETDHVPATTANKCCKWCLQPVVCLDPETQWYEHVTKGPDGYGIDCPRPKTGPNGWVMGPQNVVDCGASEPTQDCPGGVCELEEDDDKLDQYLKESMGKIQNRVDQTVRRVTLNEFGPISGPFGVFAVWLVDQIFDHVVTSTIIHHIKKHPAFRRLLDAKHRKALDRVDADLKAREISHPAESNEKRLSHLFDTYARLHNAQPPEINYSDYQCLVEVIHFLRQEEEKIKEKLDKQKKKEEKKGSKSGQLDMSDLVTVEEGNYRRKLREESQTPKQTGVVKWFNPTKGFGFIQPENGGADIFLHISEVERAGLKSLNAGQKVEYDLERDRRSGKEYAANISVIEESPEPRRTNENVEMMDESECPHCGGEKGSGSRCKMCGY